MANTVMLRQSIRTIFCMATVAALAVSFGFSQGSSTLKPPPYPGVSVHVAGVFVTPIPGLPLTAIVEVESSQILADGSTNVKKTIEHIARDFQGRIYNERRQLVSPSFTGTPIILSFHIYDPVTRLNTFLDPMTHLARQTTRPESTPADDPRVGAPVGTRNPQLAEEDLGTEKIENVWVHGIRRSRTVPATASGTGKAVVVTEEYWYSEELHLNMLVRQDDPRSGQQTVTVTHVDRNEPNSVIFQIPAGYKVVDETPERQ